jgi:uncharacterized protein YgbK (DUF1537 family)
MRCSGGITLIGRWLILADDLTGAADAGVAFARRGWAADVAWEMERQGPTCWH